MWKTRIKIKANIAAHANTSKTAQLTVDNQCNKTTDMANSNEKTEINLINIELAKFSIETKMSLADSICKTHCK